MSEPDIETFMKRGWVMTGSDGSGGHPRKYGTYSRKLREYVYNRRTITLPFMIRASTSLAAETFGFRERGLVREGYFADLIVFDERSVTDKSTYEQPQLLAEGMRWVLVNGTLAVDEGRLTDALGGRVLRGPGVGR